MISSFEKNAFCRNILANLINLKRIHSFSQSQRLWSTRRICLCWSHVTYWLCLVSSVEAGDDWQWVKCNEVLGFKSWLLKWFFTSIGTDVHSQRCSDLCSALFFLPRSLLLSGPRLPSLLLQLSVYPPHTSEPMSSHCIYIPAAPSRPPPPCDWLAWWRMSRLNMRRFPVPFPSGNQIGHSLKNLSTHLQADYTQTHTYMLGGTHSHGLTRSRKTDAWEIRRFLFLFVK